MSVINRPPVYRGIKTKTNVWRGVTAALHDNPQEVCKMTDQEIIEGFECLRWFREHGHELIEAMCDGRNYAQIKR